MAICDYCGTTYRGGAIKDGAYRYCNGQCAERGKFLLSTLARIPQNKIHAFVMAQHGAEIERDVHPREPQEYQRTRMGLMAMLLSQTLKARMSSKMMKTPLPLS